MGHRGKRDLHPFAFYGKGGESMKDDGTRVEDIGKENLYPEERKTTQDERWRHCIGPQESPSSLTRDLSDHLGMALRTKRGGARIDHIRKRKGETARTRPYTKEKAGIYALS